MGQGTATGEKNGGRHMYYATSLGRKRIIHTPDCPHCKRIREENLIEIPSIWAAFSKRYHLCKHCNPLMQKYKSEESAIQEYCSHNGLCFSIENKCFRVETPRSMWKITLEDNATCTTLYHKNELHLEKRRHDRVPGYHCQSVCHPTLLGYLEYIVEHDYFRMLNPIHLAPKKKSPRKGTKRYRKQQKRAKKQARRESIHNVLNLIDTIRV